MVYWNAGVLTLSLVPDKIELADYNMEGPKRRLENYVEEFRLALGSIPPRNHQYMKHMASLLVFFSWGCSWDESTI